MALQMRSVTKKRQRIEIVRSPSKVLLFIILAICAGVWSVTNLANAQETGAGVISGTVTDPSGAVVGGAKLTVTDVATNISSTTVTNGTGYYEVDALDPGTYKLQVTSPGFESLTRLGITLEATARLSVPLRLVLGGSVQNVVVNADASLLNTESGSSGQVLTTTAVGSAPRLRL